MPDQGFRCGVPSGQIAEETSETGGGSSSIHPFEGGEPSKTKEFDETVVQDLNHHQFLVPLLQRMVLDRHLNPEDLLFQLTPSTLREWMQDMRSNANSSSWGLWIHIV